MAGKDKNRQRIAGRGFVGLAKLASPVLKLIYYVCIALILLAGTVALIMLIVNTSAEEIMLPPFMSVHGKEYYSIFIGNGIRIDAAYDSVSLGDIKTVIYAELMLMAAFCALLAPVALFLSRLFSNIASGDDYNPKNPRYIIYIGMSAAVGMTFLEAAGRFYNYLLVKTFVADGEAIHLSMGLDPDGILVGLLIIIIAYVYKNACEKHRAGTPDRAESCEVTETKM